MIKALQVKSFCLGEKAAKCCVRLNGIFFKMRQFKSAPSKNFFGMICGTGRQRLDDRADFKEGSIRCSQVIYGGISGQEDRWEKSKRDSIGIERGK